MKIETCYFCCGRGGIGSSYGGVTLSYRQCNHCNGEGVFYTPENEEDEKQLERERLEYWNDY